MKKFNMNNLKGTDINIDISIQDYGLAWILSDCKTEYKFWYRITPGIPDFMVFDFSFLDADTDVYKEYSWAEFEDVLSFVGMEKSEWDALPLPLKISDLLAYYGFSNIFGETYSQGFTWNENLQRFQPIKDKTK